MTSSVLDDSRPTMLLRVVAILSLASECFSIDNIVNTPLGRVSGWERQSRDGRLYQAWTRIPYAQPPIGKLRFKPPKPALKWEGLLNATDDMTKCLQKPVDDPIVGSEDCLYLSVYRPKTVVVDKLPVIVRVHGGAFQNGDATLRDTADYLMDEEVLLVTLHYRLNGFGFMTLGDIVMPGNYGLKDQVMALRWVQQNIAAFGGDSKSVTLIGDSAGGASTHLLLSSPATADLVSRAVSNSGTIIPFRSLRKPDEVKTRTLQVAKLSGCVSTRSEVILECLQRVNALSLIATISVVDDTADIPFSPVIEPMNAEDAVATYDLLLIPPNKPWITGMCSGEYSYYMSVLAEETVNEAQRDLNSYLQNLIRERMGVRDQAIANIGASTLREIYFPASEPYETFKEELAKMWADATYIFSPIRNVLNHRAPKWMYRFEYTGELLGMGPRNEHVNYENVSGHAGMSLYFFNRRSSYPSISPRENQADYAISKTLIKYLVNFAYYDDPTPPGSSFKWEQFKSSEILRISNDGVSLEGESFFRPFQNILNIWSYWSNWLS